MISLSLRQISAVQISALALLSLTTACSTPSNTICRTKAFSSLAHKRVSIPTPCLDGSAFIKSLWNEGADAFFQHRLSRARRCEGDSNMLRTNLYANIVVPSGKLLKISPIPSKDYESKQNPFILVLESDDLRVQKLENSPIKAGTISCLKAETENAILWFKLEIIEENGENRLQTLEIKSPIWGRKLLCEPHNLREIIQDLLELGRTKDLNKIILSFIRPKTIDETLISNLSDLCESLPNYQLDTLNFIDGERWMNGNVLCTTLHYTLSNKDSDFHFRASFDDNNLLVGLNFD